MVLEKKTIKAPVEIGLRICSRIMGKYFDRNAFSDKSKMKKGLTLTNIDGSANGIKIILIGNKFFKK